MWEYVHLLIENLLGERSKTLDICLKNILPRCDAPPRAKLRKLEDLPLHIGNMKSTLKVDIYGNLAE